MCAALKPSVNRPGDSRARGPLPLIWDVVVQAGQRLNPTVRRYLRDWRLGDLDDTRAKLMAMAQAETMTPAHGSEHLSEANRQAIIERFMAGTTREQLAAEYGVSLSTVKRLLRKAGVRRQDWPKRSS
jgi:DNA-directed RNA polymerase specialized sigma24 family protein